MAATLSYPPVQLATRADWHNWLTPVMNCARTHGVLDFVDPTKPTKTLTEPTNPLDDPTLAEFSNYTLNKHKLEMDRYGRQNTGLLVIDSIIMQSIPDDLRNQIQRLPTIHERVKYLETYFKPSDVEWKTSIQNQILANSNPDPNSDLISWANSWVTLTQDAIAANVAGITEITMRDTFIACAARLDHAFAASYSHIPEDDTEGRVYTLQTVLRRWHLLQRQDTVDGARPIMQSNPASFNATSNNNNNRNYKPWDQQHPVDPARSSVISNNTFTPCACGNKHRYVNCYYLVDSKRPASWKPRPDVLQQIRTWLTEFNNHQQVEKALTRANLSSSILDQMRGENRAATSAHHASTRPRSPSVPAYDLPEQYDYDRAFFHTTTPPDPEIGQSFASATLAQHIYPLHDSFIFDTGADTHITNDINRFQGPLRQTDRKTKVYSGNNYIDVHGYGDALISITEPATNQKRTIILKDTAYIPSFHTNIVSGHRAKKGGIQ